jgi:hypothetical protein
MMTADFSNKTVGSFGAIMRVHKACSSSLHWMQFSEFYPLGPPAVHGPSPRSPSTLIIFIDCGWFSSNSSFACNCVAYFRFNPLIPTMILSLSDSEFYLTTGELLLNVDDPCRSPAVLFFFRTPKFHPLHDFLTPHLSPYTSSLFYVLSV